MPIPNIYFVDKDQTLMSEKLTENFFSQNHKPTALIFDKYCHFGSNFLLRCSLLSSCWDQIPTKRPTASEIAELLGGIENLSLITTLHLAPGSPRLVSPSIDVPLASVQVERTDSLEMIPRLERTRNAMFSLQKPVFRNSVGNNNATYSLEYTNMLDKEMLEEVGNTDIKEEGTGESYELEEVAETEHSYLVVSMSADSLY